MLQKPRTKSHISSITKHLEEAHFKIAQLEKAHFKIAHLEEAHFKIAQLEKAHFKIAHREEAHIKSVHTKLHTRDHNSPRKLREIQNPPILFNSAGYSLFEYPEFNFQKLRQKSFTLKTFMQPAPNVSPKSYV